MFASRHEGRRAPITRGAASVLILAFWLAASAAAETLVLDGIERQHDLSPHLSILKDPSKALGIDDVLSPALTGEFQATDGRAPSFGYTDAAFWVKFTLANATSEPLGKVLELAYPTVNELDLYVVNSEGVLRHVDSGMEHPFSARDYSYQNFLFDVDIPAQAEVTVYLRFYSVSSSLIPLVLWDRHALLEHIVTNQYVLGSIAGAFLVLILYEMFIYVSLRDRSHLYYIFFLVFGLLYQMSVKGVAYEMLWPGSYFWGERSLSFFVFATLASVSLFTMELLALKKLLPRAYRAYQVIALAMGTMAVASLIFDYGTFVFLSTVFGGIVSIFLFSCAGYFYRLKIPYSGQYLAGWLLLTVGTTLTVLKFIGALPSTLLTNYGFEFGSVFQIAFFSMALADRINHLKREVIVEEQRRVLSEEKSQELEKQNEIVRQALEQKTATSDVLRVISESQTDVVPVFDTIAERMERLSPGSIVLLTLVRDDAIHLAALAGVDGKDAALLRARFPQPADETTATGRAIGARQPVIIEDVSEVDDYALRDAAKTLGFRGALAVPVVREGHALGAITLLHMRGGAFGAHETDLIRTFAQYKSE